MMNCIIIYCISLHYYYYYYCIYPSGALPHRHKLVVKGRVQCGSHVRWPLLGSTNRLGGLVLASFGNPWPTLSSFD